jgi:hypothetical protein
MSARPGEPDGASAKLTDVVLEIRIPQELDVTHRL